MGNNDSTVPTVIYDNPDQNRDVGSMLHIINRKSLFI